MGTIRYLACGLCEQTYSPGQLRNLCTCGGSLFARYNLDGIRQAWKKEHLAADRRSDMWRYDPVLPADSQEAITLAEGWTPHFAARALGADLNLRNLWVKDDGRNPTDSFKARGMSTAVTMAKKLGARKLAVASAGNAAGALAAYAAAAGLEAHIFMPRDVPQGNFLECKAFGAQVTLVDGLISDCGKIVAERKEREGWFDVSTLKEPYRVEGKKTMGYEIAEQLGWTLPDAILYPCGGGVGLIGMWKAFAELAELGWIGQKRPKMIAIQAEGCQPIVEAFNKDEQSSRMWSDAHTVASGLRVPKPLGDVHVLRAVRESGGTAIAVSDEEMMDGAELLGKTEGIFAAPEGGAAVAGLRRLIANGFLKRDEHILLYNTGSGLKYLEAFSTRYGRQRGGEQDKLGGLITPR
jgi:threonine synthase